MHMCIWRWWWWTTSVDVTHSFCDTPPSVSAGSESEADSQRNFDGTTTGSNFGINGRHKDVQGRSNMVAGESSQATARFEQQQNLSSKPSSSSSQPSVARALAEVFSAPPKTASKLSRGTTGKDYEIAKTAQQNKRNIQQLNWQWLRSSKYVGMHLPEAESQSKANSVQKPASRGGKSKAKASRFNHQ